MKMKKVELLFINPLVAIIILWLWMVCSSCVVHRKSTSCNIKEVEQNDYQVDATATYLPICTDADRIALTLQGYSDVAGGIVEFRSPTLRLVGRGEVLASPDFSNVWDWLGTNNRPLRNPPLSECEEEDGSHCSENAADWWSIEGGVMRVIIQRSGWYSHTWSNPVNVDSSDKIIEACVWVRTIGGSRALITIDMSVDNECLGAYRNAAPPGVSTDGTWARVCVGTEIFYCGPLA